MSENKRFHVNDLSKYIYSEIGEYVDEKHTLTPLRNDELCKLLNELYEENKQLRQFINKGRRLSVKELMNNINENELLKKKIKELEKENKILHQRIQILREEIQSTRQILKMQIDKLEGY